MKLVLKEIQRRQIQAPIGPPEIVACIVPIVACSFMVTREEEERLSQSDLLFLDTVIYLGTESDAVSVDDLAKFTGLDAIVLEGQVADLIRRRVLDNENGTLLPGQGLVRNEKRLIRQSTTTEKVLLLGDPPWPLRGGQLPLGVFERIGSMRAPADSNHGDRFGVTPGSLEEWRAECWGKETVNLELDPYENIISRRFVARGEQVKEGLKLHLTDGEGVFAFCLPRDHPMARELTAKIDRSLDAVPQALAQFGTVDLEKRRLHCDLKQWRSWQENGGSIHNMCILQHPESGLHVGLPISCVPADEACMSEMFIELLLAALSVYRGQLQQADLDRKIRELKKTPPWSSAKFKTPAMGELMVHAWEQQFWPLAYALAAEEDGLCP